MTIFVITAIVFSIPTVYYRAKYLQSEKDRKRIIKDQWKWQWEDWGE